MTIPEEAGKVATSAIDVLRGNPGLLVLVLMQVATLAMIHFSLMAAQEKMQARELTMIERCFPVGRPLQ
jgi:hypothetical protein